MHTNIGVTGGGNNNHQIYIDGKKNVTLKGENITKSKISFKRLE